MRVNELASDLEVTADTVRFYTRTGFLKPTKDPSNGYKIYGAHDRRLLHFILSARQLGFSVDDTSQILATAQRKGSPCPVVRQLIQLRLLECEKRFLESLRLRERMLDAISQWDRKPDQAPTGELICHLIEEFVDFDNAKGTR